MPPSFSVRGSRRSGADRSPTHAAAAAPKSWPASPSLPGDTGLVFGRTRVGRPSCPEKREPVPERASSCATIDYDPIDASNSGQVSTKMAEEREASVQLLKTFAPLDGLKRDNLAALAKKVSVRTMAAGRPLFKEGDSDKRTIWIVAGMVELQENGRTVAMIRGGSPEARNPLHPQIPRRVTARAVDEISYLSIDSELLDVMITWDQTGSYEVSELQAQLAGESGDDWMTTLLQTKAFHRIPPANIQAIFLRMQRVPYKSGEVVIKQGDEGDFFYAIVNGKCVVTRETPLNKEGIKLAELAIGDTFGEEALIAEAKRNATVTMTTDGVLMRLNKQDFRELMNEPLLQW